MISEFELVHNDTTVREILAIINQSRIKLCVLVDKDGRLQRTIVDGDIRRALLSGASLDSLACEFPPKEAVSLPVDAAHEDISDLFAQNHFISAIVLVDAHHKPVGLVPRDTVAGGVLLSPPHMGKSEQIYVNRAFEDNWIAPAGPNLNLFESALQKASGRAHALALSSGTAALHLALRVLNISEGDLVYVSDLTFAASIQPIFYEKARPVLIDSDMKSWNMSPEALERRLQKDAARGCLPKAVIVVHIYGQSADMDAILAVTERFGVPVIEDAAESLGATYKGKPSGSHGLLSTYSFNGNKIITTSGGGALVSDREDLIKKARMLATQGRDEAEHYQHSHVAYNYRMSNILAGVGLGQLELLDNRVDSRREIFLAYQEGLSDIPGISFQPELPECRGNRWLTVVTLDPDIIPFHPYQLLYELRRNMIECRPAWKPMHMQPLCQTCAFEPHARTEMVSSKLFLQSLCLPSGSMLEKEQQQGIINCVRNFLRGQ
ncbi:MAG: aminotransferase class I/II-fold pyridoxal phosphate-dependent enzyme [Candidatus Puniceispirillaceae bacterium]